MSQEIELKLALGPEGPDALRRHPLLNESSSSATLLGNTYFDTARGELEAARMALRLRRVDGRLLQTVKTRGEGSGGLSRRGEWEWRVPGPGLDLAGLEGLPPAELGKDVLTRLEARFTTDFRRETWHLEHRGARIELALDEGEISAACRHVAIRELELELVEGEPAALWSLAETLAEHVALRPSDTSKAARGGALLTGEWRLPPGDSPSSWLHRAVVALDAHTDSGHGAWREAAADAFRQLADLGDTPTREAAHSLARALTNEAWLTPSNGRCLLWLAHRLSGRIRLA
ncbi:CYTH domain-containing protein [Halomonas icarae]|uniref:CYTH domain-containing protein n=1 Tax=Halomonas icarae TaxID=2691040 RepID=A0A7X5AMF0_9GAMM|nr:CYTH domain-containing protein [Halomonas icarae]MDR5900776.1 CYTH domain-containing protein [Halomonas icarae]NAW13756.1 CYTH domain-containing protein [Halomonas icarae]